MDSSVKTQNLGDQFSKNLELGWYCLYSQTYIKWSHLECSMYHIPQTLFYVKMFLIGRVWRNAIRMLMKRKEPQTISHITAPTTTKNRKHNIFRWWGSEQTLKSLIYRPKSKKGCDKQHLQYWVAHQLILIFPTHNIKSWHWNICNIIQNSLSQAHINIKKNHRSCRRITIAYFLVCFC